MKCPLLLNKVYYVRKHVPLLYVQSIFLIPDKIQFWVARAKQCLWNNKTENLILILQNSFAEVQHRKTQSDKESLNIS